MPRSDANAVTGLAIYPGKARSLHLTHLPAPQPGRHEILVQVLNVGVCGTDREIIEGHFGSSPPGSDELVLGHEVLGRVVETGADVDCIAAGDLVVPTVRRPDDCPACAMGQPDFCLWRGYREHGITGLHGFMVDRFVVDPAYVVTIPPRLADLGVLVEPLSVVEKALRVARAVQSRLNQWSPRTAVVFGAGPIGLLGMMLLRAEGLDVSTIARKPGPHLVSSIVEAAGARYLTTEDIRAPDFARSLHNVDVIFECSGRSEPVFEGASLLGANGVMVLLSGTSGNRSTPVNADRFNREFVQGNKLIVGSVNSHVSDFTAAVRHLAQFEQLWPGLAARLITHRFNGFEDALALMSVPGIKSVIDVPSN